VCLTLTSCFFPACTGSQHARAHTHTHTHTHTQAHTHYTCIQQILVAAGDVWKRRPTRWLKGLDGKRDFRYGVYVHEDLAHNVRVLMCVRGQEGEGVDVCVCRARPEVMSSHTHTHTHVLPVRTQAIVSGCAFYVTDLHCVVWSQQVRFR